MTTLGNIQADDLTIGIMSVLVVFAVYTLYCATRNKNINFKVLGVLMMVFAVIMVSIQNYYYNSEESRILNRFNSGNDIVCKFNENSNIVISKKRGYELKSKFFIKEEMAVNLGSCYLLE